MAPRTRKKSSRRLRLPPLPRRFKRAWTLILIAAAVALACYGRGDCTGNRLPAPGTASDWDRYHGRTFLVVKVVDGDTLDLAVPDRDQPYTRIRLWGVDTPETKHSPTGEMYYGPEASAFTRDLTLDQQVTVSLEPTKNTRGKYQRLLAYLYLPDGRMLNELLLTQGYAYADVRFPHQFRDRFLTLQQEARSQKKGLWRDVTPDQYPQWFRRRDGDRYRQFSYFFF